MEKKNNKKLFLDYDLIVNSIPALIWQKNIYGVYEFVNKHFLKLIGKKKQDVIGKTDFDIFPTKLANSYGKDDLYVIKNEKSKKGIIEKIVNEKGTLIWLRTDKAPIFNKNKQVVGTVGFSLDITNEKVDEVKLQESENKYRSLFDNIQIGVAIYETKNGKDFIIKDYNVAGAKMDHKKRNSVIGKNVLDVFPGVKDFGLIKAMSKCWKTGKLVEQPISMYRDKKLQVWRKNSIYRLPNGDIVVIYDDETDVKKAEMQLKQKVSELGKINKLMVGRELKMIELKQQIKKLKK